MILEDPLGKNTDWKCSEEMLSDSFANTQQCFIYAKYHGAMMLITGWQY